MPYFNGHTVATVAKLKFTMQKKWDIKQWWLQWGELRFLFSYSWNCAFSLVVILKSVLTQYYKIIIF